MQCYKCHHKLPDDTAFCGCSGRLCACGKSGSLAGGSEYEQGVPLCELPE